MSQFVGQSAGLVSALNYMMLHLFDAWTFLFVFSSLDENSVLSFSINI